MGSEGFRKRSLRTAGERIGVHPIERGFV